MANMSYLHQCLVYLKLYFYYLNTLPGVFNMIVSCTISKYFLELIIINQNFSDTIPD